MNNTYVYISIILMAIVTYIIRMLPLVIFKKPIKNRFFRSFLYYAPYITLSVLTFPAILSCTGNHISAAVGFAVSVLCALLTSSLPLTALTSCLSVFLLSTLL